MALQARKVSMAFQKRAAGPGADTSYNGLYQEALPDRGTFLMLQV